MTEVQIVPLTRQESEWVESRLPEQLERMNDRLMPLRITALRGGQDLPGYSEDDVRAYLTKIAIKARRER